MNYFGFPKPFRISWHRETVTVKSVLKMSRWLRNFNQSFVPLRLSEIVPKPGTARWLSACRYAFYRSSAVATVAASTPRLLSAAQSVEGTQVEGVWREREKWSNGVRRKLLPQKSQAVRYELGEVESSDTTGIDFNLLGLPLSSSSRTDDGNKGIRNVEVSDRTDAADHQRIL
jgi:hypothetical protein